MDNLSSRLSKNYKQYTSNKQKSKRQIFGQKHCHLIQDMKELLELAKDPGNVSSLLQDHDKVKRCIGFCLKYNDLMYMDGEFFLTGL